MASNAFPSPLNISGGAGGTVKPRLARDLDWLVPLAAITSVELILWLVVRLVGLAPSPLVVRYGALGELFLGAAGLVVVLFELFRMMQRGETHPLDCFAGMFRKNATRILAIIVAVQLSAVGGAAFSALKTAIPAVIPFWLDPHIASFESRALGTAPWALSQHLFGWATPAIDYAYASWLSVQIVAFYTLILMKPSDLKTRALVSQSLAWLILGIIGAYFLSSAGPIFYDRIYGGHAFTGLHATLEHASVALQTSDMLWRGYFFHTDEIASGISAMPSLHVAMALWLALVTSTTRFAALAWAYYVLIWIGSVHLGWHYISDGLVGSVGMYVIWRAAGRKQTGTSPA